MKAALATAKSRFAESSTVDEPARDASAAGGMPDLSALAGMMGGGGGGMPDLASMMRNPQMMAM
jgi:small glutamine-rich tetratricopeptide repeat-containing protein alpha